MVYIIYINILLSIYNIKYITTTTPLYVHFKFSSSGGAETSKVTPTPSSDSDPPPRVAHPRNFSRHSTSIFTFLQALEPKPPTSSLLP